MKKATLILLSLTITLTAGWVKTYGEDDYERGYCVQQTDDGGYIISGMNRSRGGSWLLKTDSLGDTLWTLVYGDATWIRNCVQITSDGNYIATGGGLFKIDKNGNILWEKNPGWTCNWVEETFDGGYIVTGDKYHSLSGDPEDWCTTMEVMKTDPEGNKVWSRSFGTLFQWATSSGKCVQQTSDGGYILIGYYENWAELWLIKMDSLGSVSWEQIDFSVYGAEFVRQTPDGGFILTAELPYTDGGIFLRKTDSLGEAIWDKSYGISSEAIGRCVQMTTDGGYVVTGNGIIGGTWGKVLLKTDSLGDTLWARNYGGGRSHHCQLTSDGGYIITGYSGSHNEELWLCKVDSLGYIAGGVEEQPQPETQPTFEVVTAVGKHIVLRFSPSENRSQGEERSHLGIFDASGRLVDELLLDSSGTITWGDGFSPGVYFIMSKESPEQTHKVILVR